MAVSKIDFNCPSCGKKNRVKIKNMYSKEEIPDILNREIFKIECSKCNKNTLLDYPFTYEDDKYIIYYNMEDTIEENKIKSIKYMLNELRKENE